MPVVMIMFGNLLVWVGALGDVNLNLALGSNARLRLWCS